MPSDIPGTDILEEDPQSGKRVFKFLQGPVFTNLLLADEINRTPPKTQAALLQAMQEHTVTAGGKDYPLAPPFLVFATQNPIEQEGTYPLPEAQLDRFMFHIELTYPSKEDERRIARWTTTDAQQEVRSVVTREDILAVQSLVRQMEVSDAVVDVAVDLVRATRPEDESAPEIVRQNVSFGAGPRAVQSLILGAKARSPARSRASVSRRCVCPCAQHLRTPHLGELPRRSRKYPRQRRGPRADRRPSGETRVSISRFIDPQDLKTLAHAKLRARSVVEGLLTGMHRNPLRGSSVEFSEYKEYVPGDELKYVDWRAFARVDRYYVKQFEDETHLRTFFLLDQSGSMDFAYGENTLTKYEYGATLCAAMSWLMLSQGDAPGLMLFDDKLSTFLPTSTRKNQLDDLCALLDEAKIGGKTNIEERSEER